jgi:hypothetical protein
MGVVRCFGCAQWLFLLFSSVLPLPRPSVRLQAPVSRRRHFSFAYLGQPG